jgi:hypothetical protein
VNARLSSTLIPILPTDALIFARSANPMPFILFNPSHAVDHTRDALRRLNRRLNAISRVANRINTALTDGSMRAAHAIGWSR